MAMHTSVWVSVPLRDAAEMREEPMEPDLGGQK